MKVVYVKVMLDNTVGVFSVEGFDEVKKGDYVIVETRYGNDIGKVISDKFEYSNGEGGVKGIVSKATEKDLENFNKNLERAVREEKRIKDILKKYNPEAHFVGCYFLLDGRKLIVNFSSDERIDFRETVKVLAGIYKMRIEMRQISPREAFKIKGGMGICGMECCCYRFNYLRQHVSANLVKEQGLSETNAKVIGPCGKLVCCLTYEAEFYRDGRHILCEVKQNVDV